MAKMLTLLLASTLVLITGCATRAEPAPTLATGDSVTRMAPTLTLERFLRAANSNDLQTMGELFGTQDGSIRRLDSPEDVERRMYALASVLRHDDYELVGDRIVPGRLGRAVELDVRMVMNDRAYVVPFTMVRVSDDLWLVEQIDVAVLTR
ncbi:MAG: hypothetical protein ACRELD_04565 [Longimicrobiales bacterium]